MKKAFVLLTFLLLSPSVALAASPTPTNSTASEDLIEQIDELKDKVASRVAELKLVEKRGIIGKVTEAQDTQITIEDVNGDTRFIDVDELTKFDSDDESFGISDVEKGMELGVLGLYNKESRRLLARFVNVLDFPKMHVGVVSDKDEDAFVFTLTTSDNKELPVDVENVTRTFEHDEDGALTKSGFTQIEIGQNVTVVGFEDSKDPKRLSASRIIIFPGIPKNPKIILKETPAPTKTSSPSATKKPSPTP